MNRFFIFEFCSFKKVGIAPTAPGKGNIARKKSVAFLEKDPFAQRAHVHPSGKPGEVKYLFAAVCVFSLMQHGHALR
jgi:hypothetical protein